MSALLDTRKTRETVRRHARTRPGVAQVREVEPRRDPTPPFDLGSENLFAELGFADAQERLLKATLVTRIRAAVSDRGLNQTRAATIMDIPQPKASELLTGSASGFGAERLVTLLNKLGVSVYVAFHQEPDFNPGETTFGWDRDRDSENAMEDEPSEEATLRP